MDSTIGLTATENADPKASAFKWRLVAIIGALVVCALIVTVVAVVILTSESTGSTTGYDDAVLSGGGDGRGQGEIATPVIFPARTPSTTTAGSQYTSSTSAATLHTRALTVCTVTDGPEPLHFPDDGLCEFVFFDSLAVPFERRDFSVAGQSSAVQRFVNQAKVAQRTRYGMSVSFSDAQAFDIAIDNPAGKVLYESYWSFNVYDWGFLSIDEPQEEEKYSYVHFALTALKMIQEHALSKNVQRPSTFLGIYVTSEQVCDIVAENIKKIFTPTGIVLLGHSSYEYPSSHCVIMPPVNFLDPSTETPAGITYGHSMRDAMTSLECLWDHGIRTNMSLSVTMQARKYKLKSGGQGKPAFYSDCETGSYEKRITAQEICDNPNSGYSRNINYDGLAMTGITYDHQDGFAITYENRVSLRMKICDAWTLEAKGIGVGLAVYDLNYDSRSTKCKPAWLNGTWSRFRFLLRLRDFLLHEDYLETDLFQDCIRVK